MKYILQFVKPYKGLTALALLFVTLDVLGALVIPTITADMINVGVGSRNLNYIMEKGVFGQAVGQDWTGYEKRPVREIAGFFHSRF